MKARTSGYAAAGFALGLAVGALVWGTQMRRFRRDLFSSSAVRRLAALGYLRGSATPDTVRVLRDYVRWERNPGLRRRAEKLLARLAEARHN